MSAKFGIDDHGLSDLDRGLLVRVLHRALCHAVVVGVQLLVVQLSALRLSGGQDEAVRRVTSK